MVKDSPICASSSQLLRSYMIATMPLLRTFNDEAVSPSERFSAERQFKPLLDTLNSSKVQNSQLASLLGNKPQMSQVQRPKGPGEGRLRPTLNLIDENADLPDGKRNFSDVFEQVITGIIFDTLNKIRPS